VHCQLAHQQRKVPERHVEVVIVLNLLSIVRIDLVDCCSRCDKISNYNCETVSYVDGCRATCEAVVTAKAELRGQKPVVRLSWKPLNVPHRTKVNEN